MRSVRRPPTWPLALLALAACTASPPTKGSYARREAYGAVILHLGDTAQGRVTGDIAYTRLGRDGGIRVFSRRLAGTRDGDRVTLADDGGDRIGVVLTKTGAQLHAPDGGTILLDRVDARGEAALLAALGTATVARR